MFMNTYIDRKYRIEKTTAMKSWLIALSFKPFVYVLGESRSALATQTTVTMYTYILNRRNKETKDETRSPYTYAYIHSFSPMSTTDMKEKRRLTSKRST